MGLLKQFTSKRPNRDGPATVPGEAASSSPVPKIDVDKAASIIEKRARGNLARQQTSMLKAHREMEKEAAESNPFYKCLTCLDPK